MLRLPRNSNLAKPSRGRANGPVSEPVPNPFRTRSETVPRPFRDRLRTGVAAEVVCAQSGSPIHAQRQRFLHLAIPQLAESACESAAPATKSILDLAKVLRLPRNSNLAKPSRGRANGPVSEPVPNPFRTRSETVPRPFRDRLRTGVAAEVVCAQSGSPIHAQRQRFLHLAIPQLAESACESAAPATKSILDLAKVLRLPRSSNLAKPSRGRANGPVSEPVPNPFRTRSETVPRPFRDRLRTGVAAEVVCAQSGSPIHAQRQRFLHLAIPQLAESACESAAPATKSILDLAKVLRLPRNSNLAKPLRGRANGPVSEPVPNPFRTRSETVPRPFRDRLRTGVAAEVVCAQSGSPIHAQRQRFLHRAIPQLAESACESAAPATKSILEKAIYVLSWLYVKAIYLSCICHASLLESYLSVKLAICQSYLFVMLATCHSYMSKQLAHLVPVLRKFLVKLPLIIYIHTKIHI